MPEQTFAILDELECSFLNLSKLGITLCGASLLGGVFLLGMATSESLAMYYDGLGQMGHSWSVVGAYVSFAVLLLFFAVIGILDIRNLLLTKAGTREFEIIKMEESRNDENSSLDDNYIFDINNNQYRVCHKLFQLLKERDIIKGEVKRMRILKINYIHRIAK